MINKTANMYDAGNAADAGRNPSRVQRFRIEHAIIAACAAIGIAIGGYRLATVKPRYQASARLYVEPVSSIPDDVWATPGAASAKEWSPPTDLLLGTDLGQIAVELGSLNELAYYSDDAGTIPITIVSNLKVETSPAKSGRGQIQDLGFVCSDDLAARRTLESVIAAYKVLADRWQSQNKNESLAALEKQSKVMFERLQRKQLELEALKTANPDYTKPGQDLVADTRLKALMDARILAELRRIEAEVKLATINAVPTENNSTSQPVGEGVSVEDSKNTNYDEALLMDLDSRQGISADDPTKALVSGTPSWYVVSSTGDHAAVAMDSSEKPASADRADRGFFVTQGKTGPPSSMDIRAEEQWVKRLEEVWGPDHPKLVSARTRLEERKRMASEQFSQYRQRTQVSARLYAEQQQRLQTAIDEHVKGTSMVAASNTSAIQIQILQQVVQRAEKALAAITESMERLHAETAGGSLASVRISTMVPPHTTLVSSQRDIPKLLVMPVGVAVLIGFALVYLMNSGKPAPARGPAPTPTPVRRAPVQESVPTRKVSRKSPVLGSMPALPRSSGRGSQRALGTFVLREPKSKSTRSVRTLAKALLKSTQEAETRCVLVTSAEAKEGKSVLLANVAVALAQSGTKVLLMDVNYSHPSQHVLLSDILSLATGADSNVPELSMDLLESGRAVMRTQLETLRVVPAWPRPANPGEILRSVAMQDFLRQSAAGYDLILMDAPSVAEGDNLDALTELADATLLVMNFAGSEDEAARTARKALRQVDLPNLGVIVNSIPPVVSRASAAAFSVVAEEEADAYASGEATDEIVAMPLDTGVELAEPTDAPAEEQASSETGKDAWSETDDTNASSDEK